MKRRGVFGILVAILVCYTAVFAQDANFYKQQIEACLSRGDCDKAQTMYDSWKELSGARDTNIESRHVERSKNGKKLRGNSNSKHTLQPPLLVKNMLLGRMVILLKGAWRIWMLLNYMDYF